MNFIEDLGVRGYLQISKVYKDKSEEIVFDDHNVIVSGMSVGLAHFFSGSGSNSITDYQNERFQVGVSGPPGKEGEQGALSSMYELSGALSSVPEYGVATNFAVVSAHQINNGTVSTKSDSVFGLIPFKNVTRINDTSVRYTIILDEDTANYTEYVRPIDGVSLTEIGLFMKNPRGLANDASILVAYRNFSKILKTSDFSLVFRWTINF